MIVPTYVHYMGAEAYGLVGFYSMLQGWFMLLDFGMTPTMIRETSRFRGGSIDALTLRRFVRTLEGIFVVVALIGAIAVELSSRFIADKWLKVQHIPLREVHHVIMLIGVIIAFRWVNSLYRGAITGFERLVWLGGFNIGIATFRYVLVLPALIYIGPNPSVFFGYQLGVAIVELVILILYTYRLLPKIKGIERVPWEWEPLKAVLGFSLTIAFTSSAWVVVTQTDKLIMSKFLPLSQYAYFTLGVLMASGVNVVSGPISGALLPRMVKMNSEGDEYGMVRLYRSATQWVAIIALPTALVLAFFSRWVLFAWTGNLTIVHAAAPILMLYALGNAAMALSTFPYYLQFAKGDVKLHLIGSVLFLIMLVPSLIWATVRFGMIGAGFAWLGSNVIYFLIWVPVVHRRFIRGLHRRWLFQDVAQILVATATTCAAIRYLIVWAGNRLEVAACLTVVGLLLLGIGAIASPFVRETFMWKHAPKRN